MTATLATIAVTLRTTEKNAPTRIMNMKLGPTCGRCGGSGQYSFNGSHSRCYGCNGYGHVMPVSSAGWEATAERATAAATDGTLDAYLARNAARARCKKGWDRAMAAWQAVDALNGYGKNWNRLDKLPNRDQVVARNKVGVNLCDAIRALDKGAKTDWVEYDRVLTAGLAELAKIKAELESEAAS